MCRLPVVLAVLGLSAASAAAAPIIGGTATTVGQYPSVVAIEVGNGLCSGTLIRPDWVLTAAHCVNPGVVGEPNQAAVTASVKVHFKSVNIGQQQGTVVHASDTVFDPGFNINALGSHDIGLIKLATAVTDTDPSPVNLVAASAPVGTVVTMVGFGSTQVNAGGSVGIEFMLANRTSVGCSIIGGVSDADLLCFSQTDGKGKCEGDSGGPSFAMLGGKLTIVGVTSFGDQSCAQFGADTRTDAEKAFLLQHIPELECSVDTDCPAEHECFNHTCIITPFQPTGLGATCAAGTDCESGQCASGPDGMKCSTACTIGDATSCPTGLDCQGAGSAGTAGACYPSSGGGGCCDAGGAGAPTMLVGLGLVVAGLRRRRATPRSAR